MATLQDDLTFRSLLPRMTLYMVRHGIAEDRHPTGADPDRRLTKRGAEKTALVARALKRMNVDADLIISSPYVRARQTAEILAEMLGYTDDIVDDRRLTPSGDYDGISAIVNEYLDAESILVTGHEPSMGTMISGLCAGGGLLIDVKKASVTAIEIMRLRPHALGALKWMLTPRIVEDMMRRE